MKIKGYFEYLNGVQYFRLENPKEILGKTHILIYSNYKFSTYYEYILEGEFKAFKENNNYVQRFSVHSFNKFLPEKEKLIIKYLKKLGISKEIAIKTIRKFPNHLWENLIKNPQKFEFWENDNFILEFLKIEYKAVFKFLNNLEFEDSTISNIIRDSHYFNSKQIINEVKEQPFLFSICQDISYIDALKLQQKFKTPVDQMSLVQAGIIEVLLQSQNGGSLFSEHINFPPFINSYFLDEEMMEFKKNANFSISGNTCLNEKLVYLQVLRLLNKKISYDYFSAALKGLELNKKIFHAGEIVYLRYIALREISIANKIKEMLNFKLEEIPDLEKIILFFEKKNNMKLSQEQEMAVKTALNNCFSIITGGPGTGKSSILTIILSAYKYIYPDKKINLIAPTGRAAKRMTETTGLPASTVHSLLNLSEGEISIEKVKKIDSDLIIIDESSMLDIYLFYCLLNSIKDGCQIVLVGDPEQLPSVSAGNVLLDLINSNSVPLTKLTVIFRQASGSTIAYNARKIRIGESKLEFTDDFKFIEAKDDEEILKITKRISEELLQEYTQDDICILSAFRQHTLTGSNNMNLELKPIFNKTKSSSFKINGFTFNVNDKVMCTKNYKNLANGDIGTILNIEQNKVTINFENTIVDLKYNELSILTLAFSTTVHKSQGAEYPVVIQIISDSHKRMLDRNLIYTGITRAKKKIILIGNKATFNDAITKEKPARKTCLAKLLAK